MKDFKNRVVVITGAGSGIGRALAVEFHRLGATLALNDYNKETLQETISLIASEQPILHSIFDVSDKETFYAFADEVAQQLGRVDVVINNAGVAISKLSAAETSIEDYEWIMGINLWGMMYGSLAFLPYLRQQKASSLVNISSIFGIHGIPYQSAYSTTKFGIRGFTESLAIEEKFMDTGVVVSSVHPGGIKTNIARDSKYADRQKNMAEKFEKVCRTTPTQAAKIIIKGIQKRKLRILVGPDAKFFFLINKLPRPIMIWFLKKLTEQLD